ncbi:MAG TPA: hypothetical protein VGM92_10650 [Candidatus Kapabacteria bacterium]|jgi:hypothetical protein
MEGIQYITDDDGTRKAVVIDLTKWSDLWEDFEDILYVRSHANEARHPWSEIDNNENGSIPD